MRFSKRLPGVSPAGAGSTPGYFLSRLRRELIWLARMRRPGQVHLPYMGTDISQARHGFGIFINTVFEGEVTLWRDGEGKPYFFETSKEAEVEIIEDLMARLQECLDGERELDDAITVEEYILPVERLADGSLRDEWGREHG